MNNADLLEIEKELAERRAQEVVATGGKTPTVPSIPFANPAEKPTTQTAQDKAGELVESAFQQAVVHKVATDEAVQTELLDSAGKVIKNKTSAIRERADQEEKEAYFNNRKGACDCFGYNEATTPKWAVNVMNIWHNVMTALWLFIGFFTFAPVTFVAKKITVIFKKTWLAVLVALVLYLAVTVGIPLLTVYLKK